VGELRKLGITLDTGLHLTAQFEDEPSEPVPVSRDAGLAGDLAAGCECAPLRAPPRARPGAWGLAGRVFAPYLST
jgi:hypothetical protein